MGTFKLINERNDNSPHSGMPFVTTVNMSETEMIENKQFQDEFEKLRSVDGASHDSEFHSIDGKLSNDMAATMKIARTILGEPKNEFCPYCKSVIICCNLGDACQCEEHVRDRLKRLFRAIGFQLFTKGFSEDQIEVLVDMLHAMLRCTEHAFQLITHLAWNIGKTDCRKVNLVLLENKQTTSPVSVFLKNDDKFKQ